MDAVLRDYKCYDDPGFGMSHELGCCDVARIAIFLCRDNSSVVMCCNTCAIRLLLLGTLYS
jgi:hypothetical protein